jgi:hypothetical protein
MESAALAYVAVIIGGISLQSVEPVGLAQCEALKAEHPAALCIEVEEPCGKGADSKCYGKVTDKPEATARKATAKKRSTSRSRSSRYRRSSSRVTVGQLVKSAF